MGASRSRVALLALAWVGASSGCAEPQAATRHALWAATAPPTGSRGWPMFHHDASHAGATPVSPSHSPSLIWRFRTGGEVWGAPAIGDDSMVYVGSLDGKIYAIDGHSGKELWSFQTFSAV